MYHEGLKCQHQNGRNTSGTLVLMRPTWLDWPMGRLDCLGCQDNEQAHVNCICKKDQGDWIGVYIYSLQLFGSTRDSWYSTYVIVV